MFDIEDIKNAFFIDAGEFGIAPTLRAYQRKYPYLADWFYESAIFMAAEEYGHEPESLKWKQMLNY